MRIHILQHADFEDEANINVWAIKKKYPVSRTLLYNNERLPDLNDFDLLVVMGGPMNIYEEEKYPWLKEEKEFLKLSIQGNKKVLGICLGAQLLSDVLQGKVYKNAEKEIGWYPVKLLKDNVRETILDHFPDLFTAFHWHGDTFSIPPGAKHIAKSDACQNQGFIYKDRVVALQFHLESSNVSIDRLITNCGKELTEHKFIQNSSQIRTQYSLEEDTNILLISLLDRIDRIQG